MLSLRILGALMLMCFLCDADSTCPTDTNPLVLDPPELIGKFGETLSVNCTSTEEYHDGMYWKIGNKSSEPSDSTFTFKSVPLSDWNIMAECTIELNDTHRCSKALEITIYKTPDSVSVSSLDHDPMVEGTEHLLTCDIINVAPVQNLTVNWYRGNEMVHTHMFNTTSVTPVNETSTLRVTPQRDYNGALFRCEAELHLGPNGPELVPSVTSSPYTAVVHYKPQIQACPYSFTGVEHKFSIDMLFCQADGNPQPTVWWYYQGELISTSEHLNRTHSGTYTLEVVNRLGRSNTSVDITIQYAPELKNNADIEDVLVYEGDDVTLNCDAEGNPPPVFHWVGDGLNITENTNSLNITQVTTDSTINCTAINHLGSITKQIRIHVIKITVAANPAVMTTTDVPAQSDCPLVLMPAEVVVRFGDPVSINCSTSTTDIVGMGWEAAIGGTGFSDHTTVTWRIEKLQDWSLTPQCYVTLDNDQCSKMPTITVYKTPDSVSVASLNHGPMVEGTEHLLTCDIINVAPVQNLTVNWYRGNEMVHTHMFKNTNVTPVNETSTLRVTPQRDYNRALFRCEAELHLGPNGPELVPSVTSSPYTAVVHYAPVFMEGNHTKEVTQGENVTFSCHAEGNPSPGIQWQYTSAANVKEATRGRQMNISVTGATSTNAGVYICVATNEVGRVTRSVTLIIKDKASRFPPILWLLLTLLIIIVVVPVIIFIYQNRRKKHGQYSFPMTAHIDME